MQPGKAQHNVVPHSVGMKLAIRKLGSVLKKDESLRRLQTDTIAIPRQSAVNCPGVSRGLARESFHGRPARHPHIGDLSPSKPLRMEIIPYRQEKQTRRHDANQFACRRQTWLPGKLRSILFPLNSSALVWDNTSNLVLAPKNPNRLSATRSMVLPSNNWIIRPGRLPP
jgi:hypothetical protein